MFNYNKSFSDDFKRVDDAFVIQIGIPDMIKTMLIFLMKMMF